MSLESLTLYDCRQSTWIHHGRTRCTWMVAACFEHVAQSQCFFYAFFFQCCRSITRGAVSSKHVLDRLVQLISHIVRETLALELSHFLLNQWCAGTGFRQSPQAEIHVTIPRVLVTVHEVIPVGSTESRWSFCNAASSRMLWANNYMQYGLVKFIHAPL